jgi:hypothetical protein
MSAYTEYVHLESRNALKDGFLATDGEGMDKYWGLRPRSGGPALAGSCFSPRAGSSCIRFCFE